MGIYIQLHGLRTDAKINTIAKANMPFLNVLCCILVICIAMGDSSNKEYSNLKPFHEFLFTIDVFLACANIPFDKLSEDGIYYILMKRTFLHHCLEHDFGFNKINDSRSLAIAVNYGESIFSVIDIAASYANSHHVQLRMQ